MDEEQQFFDYDPISLPNKETVLRSHKNQRESAKIRKIYTQFNLKERNLIKKKRH